MIYKTILSIAYLSLVQAGEGGHKPAICTKSDGQTQCCAPISQHRGGCNGGVGESTSTPCGSQSALNVRNSALGALTGFDQTDKKYLYECFENQNCDGQWQPPGDCEGFCNQKRKVKRYKQSKKKMNNGTACPFPDGHEEEIPGSSAECNKDCCGQFTAQESCGLCPPAGKQITKTFKIVKPKTAGGKDCKHQDGFTKQTECPPCPDGDCHFELAKQLKCPDTGNDCRYNQNQASSEESSSGFSLDLSGTVKDVDYEAGIETSSSSSSSQSSGVSGLIPSGHNLCAVQYMTLNTLKDQDKKHACMPQYLFTTTTSQCATKRECSQEEIEESTCHATMLNVGALLIGAVMMIANM